MKRPARQTKRKYISNKHSTQSALKSLVQFFFMVPAIVLLVAVGSLLTSPAHAASGINKQINFQGKLVDNNGLNVADNTYTVVFSLYNVSSGGSATWTETDSVSTSNGVFQVALGGGTPFPGNVDFNSDTWYLGIKVGSDAEMTPRIRFSAVPYAFNAAALDGIVATNSATQFTITGGTNALIDLTVNGSLTLGSTIKPTAAGGLTVASNGANGLTLDTGGAAAVSIGATANSITFGATNNPTYSFNGTGAVTFQGTSFTLGNGSTATIQTSSNAGLSLLSSGSGNITLGQNAGNGTVVVHPNAGGQAALIVDDKGLGDIFTASAAGIGKFVINHSGNVGIQNASLNPQAHLDIGTNGDGVTAIQTGGGVFSVDQYGHVNGLAFNYSSNSNWYSDYQNAQHSLDGFVKVNNTGNPVATLDIRSAVGFNSNFSFGTLPVASVSGATTFAGLVVDQSGSGDIVTASSSGATRFTVSNTGTVTIASGQSYTGQGAVTLSSGGTSGLTLNSASGRVTVATGDFLNSGLAGASGAISGDIWYDTTAQKFKINENGVTKILCNLTDTGCGTGGAVTLQAAYTGGQTIDLSTTGTGLTIGTSLGTQNIVFAPNAGGQAGLVINDQGLGPILTASASGSTVLVLSHAGNLGIGSSNPQQALTLGSTGNFAGEMAVPTGATATIATGGSLAKTSYFYKITASDGTGETIGSTETTACTSTGSSNTCNVSWTAVPNAVSYKIYRTSTSGSYTGTNFLTTVTTTSYSDTGAVALTSGTPPIVTSAYVMKLSASGNSWLLGGNFGIGTTTPLAPLDIEDGNSAGNAAFIVDQIGASTNDILTGSASGVTKFIVHNDGSIQTLGNNATADITTITGGNGLTIAPKANAAGAGGGLTLKGANGAGAAGGNVVIDAGTGTTNGTISIGTTNQSGLTLGRSGAATTINGSSVVLGAATSVNSTLTVTANTSSALTVGANGSTNPVLQVDASTTSVATGLKVLGAATGGTTALSVIDSGTNASLSIDAKGSGTITLGGTSTGTITLGRATGISGTLTVTSSSATAFAVGANGSTNPVLAVNASTGSVATGLQVLGAATGGTTALSVTDSGSNANLSIDAKGSGTITIGGNSTGSIIIGGSTNGLTFSTASGPSYAGTGRPTKSLVLSAEYSGAVLTASGSAAISGNMTSDASPSAVTTTANNYENYYMWSATALGSDQQYTVAVRVTLPKDFSDWASGNAITVDFNTPFTNSALNSLDVFIYKGGDTTGRPVAFSKANVSSISKNWAQVTFTKAQLTSVAPTLTTAGQQAVFYLTLHSTNTVNYVQVGDITLNYLAAF